MSAQSKAPVNQAAEKDRSFRILVVDDDPVDRELLIRQIRRAWPFEYEFHVEKAVDGEEALEKLARETFTTIVLDWHLPKLQGLDVLHAIRANGVNIPVIIVSGVSREEIADDLESLGAVYLKKRDITPASLRDAMATSARSLTDHSAQKGKDTESTP